MKKILFLLFAFTFLVGYIDVSGQAAVNVKYSKTFIGNPAAAGTTDTTVIALAPDYNYSIQIKPRLGVITGSASAADSIYSSVKLFVSNSATDPAWTPIACNDTYTTGASSMADTLVTATASLTTYAAWRYLPTLSGFRGARLKVVLTQLAKTNETNYYYIYFVAKPSYAWTHMY